ncbi:MAG: hypothetical protein V4673_13210 [Pseudomonadota bacterium]
MREFGYEEARTEKIIRPQKPRSGFEFDLWVTKKSAHWQRKHFVQIRRYQAIECNDGMFMTTSDDCWRDFVAYSFLEDYYDKKTDSLKCWLVGTAGFTDNDTEKVLEYCWIHPFWRGRGLLRRAWPKFSERFGPFHVSHPHSSAMRGFLTSVGYQEPGQALEPVT